jgi:hypothetical protein
MKPLIILTSALNTKFGVHTNQQRLQQTLDSIASIRKYAPTAKIAIVEMGGIPPIDDQINTLSSTVEYYFNYANDEDVQGIFHSSDNWDMVKNTTEVMVFGNLLERLIEDKTIDQFDRIFKMSGRYQLTENFDPAVYDNLFDRIVVLQKKHSQFPPGLTGLILFQYMSRLWSWPANQTPSILDTYTNGFAAMVTRIAEGGYFDIEHMLYKFLPADLITELPYVGLRGLLGPNGIEIED